MSKDWVNDIIDMHTKFNVNEKIRLLDVKMLKEFLMFRFRFLQEEMAELEVGIGMKDADLIVDSLIDLAVVTIGTLDAFDVDPELAWDRVHAANMMKSPGIKASRPNIFGLPDLIKPTMATHGRDWVAPFHHDNVGLLTKAVS